MPLNRTLFCGVPQGSVLVPPVFLVHVSPLVENKSLQKCALSLLGS